MNNKTILKNIHNREVTRYKSGNIPTLLKMLIQGKVARRQLGHIILIRYQLANFFENFLEHVMEVVSKSNLPIFQKNALYQAVYQNYLEEIGSVVEYGGAHSEGRETLLNALGYNYIQWQKTLGRYENPGKVSICTNLLLEHIRSIVSRGPIEAITALWYYENRIALQDGLGDYHILLRAFEFIFHEFKKSEYKEGDILWHIASHAEHDVHHAQLAVDGLNTVPYSKENAIIIQNVCTELQTSFDWFWNLLWNEVQD